MKVGAGPHGPGITVRWQCDEGGLCLSSRREPYLATTFRKGSRWVAIHHGVRSYHQHRWQAKRWVECKVGNEVRKTAEMRAKWDASWRDVVDPALNLVAAEVVIIAGAAALLKLGDHMRKPA